MQHLDYVPHGQRYGILPIAECPNGSLSNVDGRCTAASTVYLLTAVPYAHGGVLSIQSLEQLRCLRDRGDDCQCFVPTKR